MRVYVYLFSKDNYLSFEKIQMQILHLKNIQMQILHLKNITTQTYLQRALIFRFKTLY